MKILVLGTCFFLSSIIAMGNCGFPMEYTFTQSTCNSRNVAFASSVGSTISIIWNFGDGNMGNGANVQHTYANHGTYMVMLIVQFTNGCIDTLEKSIAVVSDLTTSLISNSDTTICSGQSITLAATQGISFCWNPVSGLSNANSSNPIATPTTSTTYYYTAQVQGSNLVTNGNFSNGNTGFTSQYSAGFPNTTEGQYWVANNPSSWNVNFNSCVEHTTGSGNMMMVNGSSVSGAIVWSQIINVLPNTNYEFSTWIQSLAALNPANLRFSINDIIVGASINAGNVACEWSQFYTVWNSGNNTTATIRIVNNNTVASGNDFAIDDISFSKIDSRYDSVSINVTPKPTINSLPDTSICTNQSIELDAWGASNFYWIPPSGLSNPNVANPIATPSSTVTYSVVGYDVVGCSDTATLTISVNPLPVFAISSTNLQTCEGDEITLAAIGADSYQWYNSSQANLGTQSQLTTIPTQNDIYYVSLYDADCRIYDTLSATVSVSPYPVIALTKSNDVDCSVPESQLTATGGSSYQWSPTTFISNPSISNPIVFPDKDTWYKVIVSNAQGCQSEDSILVRSDLSKGQATFYVPNGFTPNSDGKNDCFGVRYWGPSGNFEISIYNRWGQLVYWSKDPNGCWDGKFKGIEQPPSVFVYQIKSDSPCSATPVYRKGTVTLIR